mgnify:CR=1 FL=1
MNENVEEIVEKEETRNNCYNCINMREVPGECHIQCVKPDPHMKGNLHGIRKGWFFYPLLFDPVWMEKKCDNYEAQIHPNQN